jgi:hypothetical protein
MFINERPVAVSETNLFDPGSDRYMQLKEMTVAKGHTWSDNHRMRTKSATYDFTTTQTKLFTTHEGFDTRFYDLMFWLSGQETRRDVLKNFV